LTEVERMEARDPICNTGGCGYDANWEVLSEDLSAEETITADLFAARAESEHRDAPNGNLPFFD